MILANEKLAYRISDMDLIDAAKTRSKHKSRAKKFRLPQAGTFYAGMVVVVFLAALLLTTRYAQIAMTGYRVVELKKEMALIQADNGHLEDEINRLKSLERIEQIALSKLGMIKPDVQGMGYVAMNKPKANPKADPKEVKVEPANKNKTIARENGLIKAFASLISNWQGKLATAEARDGQ